MKHQPYTKRLLTAFLLILLAAPMLRAQERGQLAPMRGAVPDSYNFWVYAPPEYIYDHFRVPLIIFLHGRSLCGNDLERVRRYGLLDAVKRGQYFPAMILAPQNPGGPWNPRKIMKIVDWMADRYDIDTTRIYAIGMSLGGYGTMDLAGTYPDRIAAAMAICGGTTLKDVSGMGRLPLWILHGTADAAVSINESKKVVSALQAAGTTSLLRFDWMPGASHGALARLLYLKQTFDWLSWHTTADRPRAVNRDISITMNDLKEAYTGFEPTITEFEMVKSITRRERTAP